MTRAKRPGGKSQSYAQRRARGLVPVTVWLDAVEAKRLQQTLHALPDVSRCQLIRKLLMQAWLGRGNDDP